MPAHADRLVLSRDQGAAGRPALGDTGGAHAPCRSRAVPDRDARIADPWGRRSPYGQGGAWPSRVDSDLVVDEADVKRWVQTASLLHSNGDAMDIAVAGGRIVGVPGRAGDRVNRGPTLPPAARTTT